MAIDFAVDFSPIGRLGQVYDEARTKQARERALAELGNTDDPDAYARVGRALMASGDLAGGQSLAALGLKFADRKTARDLAREYDAQYGAGQPAAPQAQSVPQPQLAPSIKRVAPAVVGSNGAPASPDAEGVYGADAVMLPGAPAGQTPAASAISGIESGGRYDALGVVIPKTGDRAYGKYQVMGANIPAWTKQYVGREMTPQEFLRDPDAQEAVYKGEFGRLAAKYGPEGAARAWFAGEGGMNDPNRSDPLGTTVRGYSQKFVSAGGAAPAAFDAAQPAQPQPAPAQPGGAQWQPPAVPKSAKALWLERALQTPGLPEAQAKLYETMLQNEYAQSKATGDIIEFEYAKRQGFKGDLEQWMQRKKGGAGEYGLQPIWGTGPDGKPAIIQLGKGGDAIATRIPGGIQVGKDVIKVDAGTHTILLDPVTRAVIGQVSKNIEQKESAEERGKAQGLAQVALPGALSQSELALKTINQIRQHPGRNSWFSVGALGGAPPIPGTNQAGFIDLVEQAKGQTFLTAFERLKGAGAITEIEGAKATQAIARLNRKASDADFNMALQDLEEVIRKGVETAKAKAAGAQVSQPTAPAGSPAADGWIDVAPGVRIREKR